MEHLVSVIIPTTPKEKEILHRCVEAVTNSTYKNIEIIVVDEGKERSAQRNIGIQRAKGEYLLILDSDQLITPYLIEECVDNCDKDKHWLSSFDALYIPERIVTKGFFGYLRNWERGFYTATPVDVVRFVKREYCPLFDESMSGPEDSDWDRRIKGDKGATKRYLNHLDNVSFLTYLRKKAYYSKSMKRFEEKWPEDKVLNFWWRCFGVFFEDGKWKRVLSRPDLFICLMGLIFIRGIIYVFKNA